MARLCKALRLFGDDGSPASGDLQEVARLLDARCDINEEGDAGWTPLMQAANAGHCDVVQLLVDRKANVNSLTHRQQTALHHATQRNHMAVIACLVQANVDVDISNNSGATSLHLAAQQGCTPVVDLLITHKATLNVVDHSQATPLHKAVDGAANLDCVKRLVHNTADVNLRNEDGKTAFDIALWAKETSVDLVVWAEASDIHHYLEKSLGFVRTPIDSDAHGSQAVLQYSVPQVIVTGLSGESVSLDVAEEEIVATLQQRVADHLGLSDDVRVELVSPESNETLKGDEPVKYNSLRVVVQKRLRIALIGGKIGTVQDPTTPPSEQNEQGRTAGVLCIVDLKDGSVMREFCLPEPPPCLASVAEGLACPSSSEPAAIDILDCDSGSVLKTMRTKHSDEFDTIIAFQTGLATADCQEMEICTVSANGSCQILLGHDNMVLSLATIGDDLASGDSGKQIRIWDVTAGVCVSIMDDCHDSAGWVFGLCELEANIFASCSDTDNNVKLWDRRVPTSVSCIRACGGPQGECVGHNDVCAVHEGGCVCFATVAYDSMVRVYDLRCTEPLLSMPHEDAWTIASSEGVIISMGTPTVLTWDWHTGQQLRSVSIHPDWYRLTSFIAL